MKSRLTVIHSLYIFIFGVLLGAIVVFNGVGLFLGNLLYRELTNPQLHETITTVVGNAPGLERVKAYEARPGVQRVTVTTDDNTTLVGTYIDTGSTKTILLLHGLYQNRGMCLDYVPMYRRLGFNVLAVDLRGHGESGGRMVWGQYAATDIDQWLGWLQQQVPGGTVGIHGASLGAAYALLHSGTKAPIAPAFYVADSSYTDLEDVGRRRLETFLPAQSDARMVTLLWAYSQACMYWNTGVTLHDLAPLQAVQTSTVPILFLHGNKDTLVSPVQMDILYDHCAAPKMKHIFMESGHANALAVRPEEYEQVVGQFIHQYDRR